jgi:hypothetical protein
MPTNPSLELTPTDGNLGSSSVPTARIGIIGYTTSGSALDVLHTSDGKAIRDTKGRGKAVDFAARIADLTRGIGIDFVTAAAATDGTAGAVTTVRAGTADGTVTVAAGSTPNDDYEVVVEILTSTNDVDTGDGEFRYSLDGGDTYTGPIAIPDGASPQDYVIPNTDITITFTNGVASPTFEDGDTFSFDCVAPGMTTTNVGAAWDALVAEPNQYTKNMRAVFVVGTPADAAATASLASTLDTKVQALAAAGKYTRVFMAAGFGAAEDETDLITALASFTSSTGRVGIAAYDLELASALDTGKQYRRSTLFEVGRAVARNPIHYDLGQTQDDGKGGGPMVGVTGIYTAGGVKKQVFNTEWQSLDTARFITPRTWIEGDGYFLTQGNMMAADGSDYALSQFGFIMDEACRVAQTVIFKYANKYLRTDATTGYIDASEADGIDDAIKAALDKRLVVPESIQEVVARVRRDVDVGDTGLRARVYLRAFDYVKKAYVDLGFVEVTSNL